MENFEEAHRLPNVCHCSHFCTTLACIYMLVTRTARFKTTIALFRLPKHTDKFSPNYKRLLLGTPAQKFAHYENFVCACLVPVKSIFVTYCLIEVISNNKVIKMSKTS